MKDAEELLSVHLCSLLAPAFLFSLNLLIPGGFVGSPQLVFSLLSLLLTLAALLGPFLFLCQLDLRFSPFRHYVKTHLSKHQLVSVLKESPGGLIKPSPCNLVSNYYLAPLHRCI